MDFIKEENDFQDKNEIKKSPDKREIDTKKKMMTLNLNSSSSQKKKLTANSNIPLLGSQNLRSPMTQVILESPDVRKFVIPTPEYIEKFLSTPSLANKHFIKQLSDLGESLNNQNNANNSNSDSSRPPSNASSSNYNFNSEQFNMQDDNSNATSLISGNNSNCSFNTSNNSANNQSFNENSDLNPLNLKNQDLTKLERKRLRNRIAASKCRKRKLERISNLEEKVQKLKNDNFSLQQEVNSLRKKNEELKMEVRIHRDNGCNVEY